MSSSLAAALLGLALGASGCSGIAAPTRAAAPPPPARPALVCAAGLVARKGACEPEKPVAHVCKDADVKECEEQCEAGSGESCVKLGDIHRQLSAGSYSTTAAAAYKNGCRKGQGSACRELARYAANAPPKDEKLWGRASTLLEEACGLGDGQACATLGAERLRKDAADRVGLEYLGKGCDAGHAPACLALARRLDNGPNATGELAHIAELLQRGCDAKLPEACGELGRRYQAGRGVTADLARASELYDVACKGGYADGCNELGETLKGPGISKDPARAQALFEQACKGGSGGGCYNASFGYENGEGVAKDAERARALLARGCDAGSGRACERLGEANAKGRGVPKDDEAAQAYFLRACEAGQGTACEKAADRLVNAIGVKRDVTAAVGLYNRACDLGVASTCDRQFRLGYGSGP